MLIEAIQGEMIKDLDVFKSSKVKKDRQYLAGRVNALEDLLDLFFNDEPPCTPSLSP